jgi:hypothetical protein
VGGRGGKSVDSSDIDQRFFGPSGDIEEFLKMEVMTMEPHVVCCIGVEWKNGRTKFLSVVEGRRRSAKGGTC